MKEYKVRVFDDRTEYYDLATNKIHRLDGPAVEYIDGAKHWYQDGKRHRLDGPAIEFKGSKEYWIEGVRLTAKEFENKTKQEGCAGKVIEFEGKKYKLVEIG